VNFVFFRGNSVQISFHFRFSLLAPVQIGRLFHPQGGKTPSRPLRPLRETLLLEPLLMAAEVDEEAVFKPRGFDGLYPRVD
jgi:hypothetical protein